MFKAPFSFSGRITRTEYLASGLLFFVAYAIGLGIMTASGDAAAVGVIILIPAIWFGLAQGWKRAQDAGWHGFISIIPYVNFALLFVSGDQGPNAHGPNPRVKSQEAMAQGTPTAVPPPIPDAWERARSDPAPKLQTISFKCTSCGAQNTNVVHSGSACCQYCGAPKG
jgi:uncharacterized membrane protein YhaH (DUF805 family)